MTNRATELPSSDGSVAASTLTIAEGGRPARPQSQASSRVDASARRDDGATGNNLGSGVAPGPSEATSCARILVWQVEEEDHLLHYSIGGVKFAPVLANSERACVLLKASTPSNVSTTGQCATELPDAERLAACPFCGSSKIEIHNFPRGEMWWAACISCGLECPSETGITKEQAVTYWNTRTPPREAEAVHKVMTPEEYAAMPLKGWHQVCKDVDGFGAVGIRFMGEALPPATGRETEGKRE